MKYIMTALMIVLLAVLAGCKDTQKFSVQNYSGKALYYTYPMNHQHNVSPHTPVVLTYLGPVTAQASDFTLTGVKQDGSPLLAVPVISVNSNPINDGKSVMLTFGAKLAMGATYTLTSSNPALQLPANGLSFTVRPDFNGSISKNESATDFKVANIIPDGTNLPFLDFSTIDLTFTHPLDEKTVKYGDQPGDTIKLMQNGTLVPATVLVNGRKMTIDPDNASGDASTNHDLAPGVPVTLTISTDLNDRLDTTAFAGYTKHFVPQDTAPRATMVQKATKADSCTAPSPGYQSLLTGMAINCVPVIAKLLGDTTNSGQKGNVFAQLAFGPHFPQVTPLRIKKGAMLKGGALKVNIGGHVSAGYDSGDVTVTFMSDADGYLLPNPYTDDPNAPKRLIMVSDMAFDTKDPRANGAFTQNLLHVTLVGAAIADPETGVLTADAVGIVEPSVLGLEHAYGILSFHMESYPDQTQAPVQKPDNRTLTLSSWVPGTQSRKDASTDKSVVPANLPVVSLGDANNIADMLRPGDPILVNFSKPLDKESVHGGSTTNVTGDTVTLLHNGVRQGFTWRLNGTSLSIYPDPALQYSTQTVSGGTVSSTQKSTYKVVLSDDLKDLQGNSPAAGAQTLTFTMPVYADVDSSGDSAGSGGNIAGHSPVVTAIYPGFPCYTVGDDLATGDAGHCNNVPADGTSPSGADDMPIMSLPGNRSIHVSFSQVMKSDTIRLPDGTDPGTFIVKKCESTTSCSSPTPVAGKLVVKPRSVTFVPQNKWKNGALYRYTLASDDLTSNADACNATGTAICSVDETSGTGHPLKTSMLDHDWGYNMGGPDMVVYFKGAPVSNNVLQLLQQYPVADLDSSFQLDPGEAGPYSDPNLSQPDNPRAALNAAKIAVRSPSGGGIVSSASVGCDSGSCPNKQYTYLTGALMADITGFKSIGDIQGLVNNGTLDINSIPPALCGGDSPCPAAANIDKGAILTWIYPTQLVASNLTTYADVPLLGAQETPTGTQVMRIRYTCNAAVPSSCDTPANGRVPGWIIESDTSGAPPQFVITLNIYMDAPNLEKATGGLTNDMHNRGLTLNLEGPLTFLPDGRLQIRQHNTNQVDITINLSGLLSGNVNLKIPKGGNRLNYVGSPIEN